METLVLARHALAGSNRDGVASCTRAGRGAHAGGCASRLARSVLSSPDVDIALAATTELARTQETLALALDGRDVPTLIVPELNEIRFGSFDGGLLDTYRAWAAAQSPSEQAPGGGESRADAAARFARGLRALLALDGDTILLVGHALALRYVLDAAEGLVPAALMRPVSSMRIPYRLDRGGVERAAELLEEWSLAPQFRTT